MGLKARRAPVHDERTIALLRGINVGGHNKMPMAELRALIEGLGARDVQTYIQSGNVVFSGALEASSIAIAIKQAFGFDISVMTRTADELCKISKLNPFIKEVDPAKVHVGFLATKPSSAALLVLDPEAHRPDQFVLIGRELFLRTPNGMGKTKFTSTFFKRLGQPCTVRNWRTVCKLIEIS